jgi:hypothetical protein
MRTLLSIGIVATLAISSTSSAMAAVKQASPAEASQSEPFVCRTSERNVRYITCEHVY